MMPMTMVVAMTRVSSTSWMAPLMNSASSEVMVRLTPGGSEPFISAIALRTPAEMSSVLARA